MTMTINADNLQQYKKRFSLIKEEVQVFALNTNFERKRIG